MFQKEDFTLRGSVASAPFQNKDYSDFGEWALWVDHRPEVVAAVKSDMDFLDFDRLVRSGFRLEVKQKSDKLGKVITVLHAFPNGDGHCEIAVHKWNRADTWQGAAFISTSTSRSGRHTTTWCVFPDASGRVGSADDLSRPPTEELLEAEREREEGNVEP